MSSVVHTKVQVGHHLAKRNVNMTLAKLTTSYKHPAGSLAKANTCTNPFAHVDKIESWQIMHTAVPRTKINFENWSNLHMYMNLYIHIYPKQYVKQATMSAESKERFLYYEMFSCNIMF